LDDSSFANLGNMGNLSCTRKAATAKGQRKETKDLEGTQGDMAAALRAGLRNPPALRPTTGTVVTRIDGSKYVENSDGSVDDTTPVLPDKSRLTSLDLEGVADLIKRGEAKRIVVAAGAGISVSAGIPDFRTPGTGLYDNLKKYDLPSPEAIFELGYFQKKPAAFYRLAKEMWPSNFKPTKTHHFIALLHKKRLLGRCLTQNIDSLEAQAGLPRHMIVAAHGNFDGAHTVPSGRRVDVEEVRQAVMEDGEEGWKALRDRHGELVKPSIVFFGESLPEAYFESVQDDLPACDLLIVMGTSLAVEPFADVVNKVPRDTPRLLLNRDKVRGAYPGFNFDSKSNTRDVAHLCDVDDGVEELARLLGWKDDLDALMQADR